MFEISRIAWKAWNGIFIWAIANSNTGECYYLCDDPFYAEKIAILRGDKLFTMYTRKGDGWYSENFEEFKKRHKHNKTCTGKNGESTV